MPLNKQKFLSSNNYNSLNKKKYIKDLIRFLFIWYVFNLAVGIIKTMNEPPRGVHQGAQCDRASIALNYYENGMNFFFPEVHETRCIDGIVSCEMPLTNYLAAMLYQLFGFNHFWFRVLTLTFLLIGLFFLHQLFCLYIKPIVSYFLIGIINASPILLFYSNNFVPDTAALGLILVAWYLFFRAFIPHHFHHPLKNHWAYTVSFSLLFGLAMAIKVTSAVQWCTMLSVLVLSNVKSLNIEIVNKKKAFQWLFLSSIIPLSWRLWSTHLAKTHNSQYFFQKIFIEPTWEKYTIDWGIYFYNWPRETFAIPLLCVISSMLLLIVFFKNKISPVLWFLSVVNTLGFGLFLSLMIAQFKYHDYYIITLLPVVVLNWIAWANFFTKNSFVKWWMRILLFAGIIWAFIFQFNYGYKQLEDRYTDGTYWEQSQQNAKDYLEFKTKLNNKGVNRNHCVLVGYDGAPNNVLYLLNLRGYRISKDHDYSSIKNFILYNKPTFFISNDSTFLNKVKSIDSNFVLIEKFKNLEAYKFIVK